MVRRPEWLANHNENKNRKALNLATGKLAKGEDAAVFLGGLEE
jgi:hypothetical protein